MSRHSPQESVAARTWPKVVMARLASPGFNREAPSASCFVDLPEKELIELVGLGGAIMNLLALSSSLSQNEQS